MKAQVIHLTAGRWRGCFATVSERRPWGVIAYIPVPSVEGTRHAPLRATSDEFTVIGEIDVHPHDVREPPPVWTIDTSDIPETGEDWFKNAELRCLDDQ